MTRLCAAMFAVMLVAAPVAAQVGYIPAQSPYLDLPWKQSFSTFIGGFDTGRDPAGVGPRPGWLAGVRYDVRLGGPVSLVARISTAPTSRRVLDPTKAIAARHVSDQSGELLAADLGLAINLTGQKSYHRIVPVLSGGVGLVSDFHGTPDVGAYRFGTKMLLTWGLGVRYHTQGRWEPRIDFTNYVWQLQYPASYEAVAADGSKAILSTGKKSPWMGNHLWSVGMTYQLSR